MAGENHRTRWTKAELEFLESEWDGTFGTAEVIAELLGRTMDAVLQRHYELTWGKHTIDEAPTDKPDQVERSDKVQVHVKRTEITFEVDPSQICTTCWTVRSATGECFC